MIQIALHRSLSAPIVRSDVRQGEEAQTSHGWRDKSTDIRRVHVVVGVGVIRRRMKSPAGAFSETPKKSIFPAPSLIPSARRPQ